MGNASNTCLLPDVNRRQRLLDGQADALEDRNIRASSNCQGALLTLSFIAKERDAVKCYLYWSAQMTRLLPETTRILMHSIFQDSQVNREFLWPEANEEQQADNADMDMRWGSQYVIEHLKEVLC